MQFKYLSLLLLLAITISLKAQSIKVQPYLQDANPNTIRILWETTEGDESIVEWGLTATLGNSTSGTSEISSGTAQIHDVLLEGLTRFTKYHYRVKTGNATSEIYTFKTAPFASDKESFRLIAMSDMQRDGSNPNKFAELIDEGVLTYVQNNFGADLNEEIAFVMIPGDLVVTGSNYSQWEEHFFTPSQALFNQVPIYPVPGNHEQNSEYYFKYFHLPDNGSTDFEEHWWYKDYSNTRIIGLDSNSPYNNQTQLDWLEGVLAEACTSDSIDFVFAQLHHPHKSELWTPGESNYTGQVIELLENFTDDCDKPSIHFFGHTHGYSRGQSQDHKHLWVNVASAGGAIDLWGDWPTADYDEFSVSQDEYGFVVVDVNAGNDPSFTLKRIGRGDAANPQDNILRDSLMIKKSLDKPSTPLTIFPKDETVNPDCVVLLGNDFSSSFGESHGASQWQISTNCTDFSNPNYDSWKAYENWYYDVDTQADDDLRDEAVMNLSENTDYCWRVRYRDRSLNWTDWSEASPFSTSASQYSQNLIINPGAESDLSGWTPTIGVSEVLTDGECDGIAPHTGVKYFAIGGVCMDGAYAECEQLVNLVSYSAEIDAGTLQANFGGYLSNWGGQDVPAMKLYFQDENNMNLDSTETISSLISSWTLFSEWAAIPVGTRIISFTLTGTRNAGADNDSYFDDLFLRVGPAELGCDEFMVSTQTAPQKLLTLKVAPNPVFDTANIILPFSDGKNMTVRISDALGQKVKLPVTYEGNKVRLNCGGLAKGLYFFNVYRDAVLVGTGKFSL